MKLSSENLLIAITTWPDKKNAEDFATDCIEKKVAACIQIDSPCTSIYSWDNKVQKDTEFRCVIKFLPKQQNALQNLLNKTHPYDIPEWILLESSHVSKHYYDWAQNSLA